MDWSSLEENDLIDGDNQLNQRNEEKKHDMDTEIFEKLSVWYDYIEYLKEISKPFDFTMKTCFY